jgi:hypothetical protein
MGVPKFDSEGNLLVSIAPGGNAEVDLDFAEIYVDGGAVAQSVTTAGVFEKFTGFTANGHNSGMTADAANDQIVVGQDGYYKVAFQISFSGTLSSTWDAVLRVAGVQQPNVHFRRKLGTGGDIGSASAVGVIQASAGDALDIVITPDGNGNSMTAENAQLVASLLQN